MSLYTDVVRYPDLFMNIFRRELHGKYRGTVLGLLWTLINPLALVAVYTLVFSILLKAYSVDHYPLFVISGLVTWVFFQSAVQMSCSSLFAQPTLVKQIRFPRHMLPMAVVATNVVTLAAMLLVAVGANLVFIPFYGYKAAAVASVGSEALVAIPIALAVRQDGLLPNLRYLPAVAAATGAMVAALIVLPEPALLSAAVASAAYAAVLLVLPGTARELGSGLAPAVGRTILRGRR